MRCRLIVYPPAAQDQHSLVTYAQQLWNNWEIQFLVVVSFSLQVFLLFSAIFWKCHCSSVLNVLLWLAYLSADSVAVFILGRLTLLVGDDTQHQSLVLFWAPFLLLHLGGQDTITAFSMEDCALWKRHLLNLATQLSMAVYAIGKQWRGGNKQLVASTVLMFISGTTKYAERILALRRVQSRALETISMEFHVSSADIQFSTYSRPYYEELGSIISHKQEKNFERVMDAATQGFRLSLYFLMDLTPPRPSFRYNLGKDLSDQTLGNIGDIAYKLAEIHLSLIYDYLYTKFGSLTGVFCRLITLTLTCTALAMFVASMEADHKLGGLLSYHNINGADITISYILLVGAITLEISSLFIWLISSYSPYMTISWLRGDLPCREEGNHNITARPVKRRQQIRERRRRPVVKPIALPCAGTVLHNIVRHLRPEGRVEWSRKLQQFNMVDWSFREKQAGWLERTMRCVGIERACTSPVHVSADLKKVLLDKMLHVWTTSTSADDMDLARFHGRWAQRWVLIGFDRLQRHQAKAQHNIVADDDDHQQDTIVAPSSEIITDEDEQHRAAPSSEFDVAKRALEISDIQALDFESSAFLWHLVTDICLVADADADSEFKTSSQELSNYVLYLVIKCKAMLSRNGRQALGYNRQQMMLFLWYESVDRKGFIQKLHSIQCVGSPSNVFVQAHRVSLELLKMETAAHRWELIATVWVEMLCYIAHNCGAGFHAKQLSIGGEFVTHVKILLFILSFPF